LVAKWRFDMPRFGPAGIPLSCKGRTLRDGIIDVHTLGLNALEYQFLRVNVIERSPYDDEIGKKIREVSSEFIFEIVRKSGRKETETISDPEEKITGKDMVRILTPAPSKCISELQELNKLAKSLDVSLSIHLPYYIDLCNSKEIIEKSISYMKIGGLIARELDCKIVVTHLGPYGKTRKDSLKQVERYISQITKWYSQQGIKAKLGLEPSGREGVIGTIDEIFTLCKKVEGTQPVINIPHIHARSGGLLTDKGEVFQLLEKAKKFSPEIYMVYSGVIFEGGNEMRLAPVKSGELRFEPVAECLIDYNYDATIISSSPLLEHDAMYLKIIYERVFTKKIARVRERLEKEKAGAHAGKQQKEKKKKSKAQKDKKKRRKHRK